MRRLKKTIKTLADLACTLAMLPLFLANCAFGAFGNRDSSFWSTSQLLSLIPGTLGIYLRKNFYSMAMTYCSRECAILFGTIFSQKDTEIGKGVYIGPNCNIGSCKIEDHCTLGSNVHVVSGRNQHRFDDLDTPIQEQGGYFKKVVIGEDTWVGNGALIMADIGKKCVVGGGAVVVHEVDDYSVVAGNPARLIKKRI